MEIYYIRFDRFDNFLSYLSKEFSLLVPYILKENFHYRNYDKNEKFIYNSFRCIEPLKTFLVYPQELLLSYFKEKDLFKKRPLGIIGVKNCDLVSLKIQDYVFMKDIPDPLYEERRKETLIISSDCTSFKEVCFCIAMQVLPYPERDFDLNLSLLDKGFLIEIGSEKGKDLLMAYKELFEEVEPLVLEKRKKIREEFGRRLKEELKIKGLAFKGSFKEAVLKNYNSYIWKEEALRCVECGACNFICGTCHCFLLADKKIDKEENLRIRTWDSCQYANFAKVAGGANPLKRRSQRLRNRFLKKFYFFPENISLDACCGCGRCIEVCPAQIDIRYILKELCKDESLSTSTNKS